MHFSLTDEEEMMRDTARRIAADRLAPLAERLDRGEGREEHLSNLKLLAENGFMALNVRSEYGGTDAGSVAFALAVEEIGYACASTGVATSVTNMVGEVVQAVGSEEQRRTYLPRLADGAYPAGAFCLTESGAGSDPAGIKTRARRDGGDWVIDGQKVFIGNGGIADVHVVVATVDPEAGHRGQGVFIVPKGTPGLTMLRKLDKLGCRASHTGEIVFEDCRVPGDQLLGGEERLHARIAKGREAEQGAPPPVTPAEEGGPAAAVQRRSSAALGAFERTRPMVAAQAIGIARAALEFARDYATERKAFGEPIIENQGIAFPLADLAADIDAARLLTWRAAWMTAQRRPFERAEGSMSKLKASEVAVRACEQAVQTLGGWGYIKDFPVEKWYRDAKLFTIFEGTSEIQRLVIGRALRAEANTDPLDKRMEAPR
jgi:acyl-CoA dehydrogenase